MPGAANQPGRFHLATTLRSEATLLACAVLVAMLGLPGRSRAQSGPDPQQVFSQLHNIKVDENQVYVLRRAHLIRDRMKLYFTHGYIGFFTPAAGKITGAVYTGEGEILLIPPTRTEKESLARFIHAPILEEQFSTAILRFTDQTAKELMAVAQKPDPDDPERPPEFPQRWKLLATPICSRRYAPGLRRFAGRHDHAVLSRSLGRQ